MSDSEVLVELAIAAPADTVWRAMRDPARIAQWFGWDATTLEWATPTPPPHGNFVFEPVVYRGPYEYSVPGHPADYHPQHVAEA